MRPWGVAGRSRRRHLSVAEVITWAVMRRDGDGVIAKANPRMSGGDEQVAAYHPFGSDCVFAGDLQLMPLVVGKLTVRPLHDLVEVPLLGNGNRRTGLADDRIHRTFGITPVPGERVADLTPPLAIPRVFQGQVDGVVVVLHLVGEPLRGLIDGYRNETAVGRLDHDRLGLGRID